jgi:hypothetical protein
VAAAVLMFLGPPRVVTSYLGFLLVAVELIDHERAGHLQRPGVKAGRATRP